ncbi:glycosyltransferase family 2 protein [Desulfatiglans anilini]|uniref:glycosyltransferase family 2 protein n=1 Tax=Desulfatiglans anilini TaxID=90728 RepID=UPI000481B6A0|nr:glycosyltransferase family 2 protein [Desulfatiglans anilini]
MRPLHIIMPMAGEGSRFVQQGFTTPKPMIACKGRSLFERALLSLEGIPCGKRHCFIVRQEHIDLYAIDARIKSALPEASIFAVSKTTRGAVETCLVARPAIHPDEGLVVMDCDLEFYSREYADHITGILEQPASQVSGGALVSFDSDNPRYSYALADEHGRVIRTAEKQVISRHALAGAYFFSKAASFISAAERLLQDGLGGCAEFYVSLLYNYLIHDGEYVFLAKTEKYYSYGTPEELSLQNNGSRD